MELTALGVMLLIWVMFCLLTNLFVGTIFTKRSHMFIFKRKLPKRFNKKKTPIYKLHWDGDFYRVQKWEIKPSDDNTLGVLTSILTPMLIPILTFDIKTPQYERKEESFIITNNGSHIPKEDIDLLVNIDLEQTYESLYAEAYAEVITWENEKKDHQTKLDRINKEFNENYIE